MSQREQLDDYIRQVRNRLRLGAGLRGAALLAVVALLTTATLALILNRYAFVHQGIAPARLALGLALFLVAAFGIALPLLRLNRQRAVDKAEAGFPAFEQRLLTYSERAHATPADPFVELLAGDTLAVAGHAPATAIAPNGKLLAFVSAAVLATGTLVWMVAARPGFVGYGASLLWTNPKQAPAPFYDIQISPGNAAVRRNSDQIVTAQIVGVQTNNVTLYARFASATGWEKVAMQPQMGGEGFQFLFAGLAENVDYYVEAGPAASKHYNFRVVDLPAVKQLAVTYRYPKWTGMRQVSEEQAGDLRALEGTDADLTITMTSPLKDGMLQLDGGQTIHLAGGEGNKYRGTIHMTKDGAYHVAAVDGGQPVRLSEDYFIATAKAEPPTVAIDHPGGDYRASPIEEVKVGVKAGAEFGLNQVSLHYSVNGGAEQSVNILKQTGAKDAGGSTTLSLEDFKLVPGDVVSLYATAGDAHAEARTDISFIQIEPFEREFSQSQQSGGGGGGGGGQQNNQTDIARREKELIEATWKQRNDKIATSKQSEATGKLLSEAQTKLREQTLALTARMQSRDLSEANEEFNSFEKDMQQAAAAMTPSADKLEHLQWQDALPMEQKALQALLRAEATFRKIEVAFGQRGGGGGGGGGSAGRDLASLFDLEMDTEKNQYETAQTSSAVEQQAKKVDDALAKLDALAKRQEELAQQQGNAAQTFQQRWQQEMLRREAEQLQREMEQMQQGQQGASSKSGQSGQAGQTGQSGQGSQSGSNASAQASNSPSQSGRQSGDKDRNADPRVQQALDRLRAANDDMKRAGGPQGAQQGSAEAKRAADRLREATNLLGGAQKQQASGKLDSLGREADHIAKEEAAQAERIKALAARGASGEVPSAEQSRANAQERGRLADDRQSLSNDLSNLEKGLRDSARELAPNQPGASSSLREALSAMDQTDLTNLMQRTADWLRSGINPFSNGTEGEIAKDLKRLQDQVRQAEQAGGGPPSNAQGGKDRQSGGIQTAALDHVDRLRNQIQSLSAGQHGNDSAQGSQPGQQGQAGQAGGQQGKSGQGRGAQPGQPGQQGQGKQPGQGNQQGGQQGQAGQQGSPQGSAAGRGGGNGTQRAGAIGNAPIRAGGGGNGTANWNVNTGNNQFSGARSPGNPATGPNPADTEAAIRQGVSELNQLRSLTKGDPAAEKQIQDLVREMQKLDPSRFPGNPAMVEQLHTQVLHDVDKLELQLRRNSDDQAAGQVRSARPATVPPGYQDAVADYYRRLGKSH